MQHRSWRRAGLAVAAIGLGLAAVVATAPAGAADKVTFSVGTAQDIDSLNPLTGALVIDYEIWNLAVRHADRQGGQGLLGHRRAWPSPGRSATTVSPSPTRCGTA